MMAAVDAAPAVVAEANDLLPRGTRGAAIPAEKLRATVESAAAPLQIPQAPGTDALAAIGEHVARLVPEGASLQFGPGGVGQATVDALTRRVDVDSGLLTDPVVDSGLLTDPVVDLDRRGLLGRVVAATYAVGTSCTSGSTSGPCSSGWRRATTSGASSEAR